MNNVSVSLNVAISSFQVLLSGSQINNEKLLYQLLKDREITFISVGHRSSLKQYHQQILELKPDLTHHLSSTIDTQEIKS